MLCLVGNKIDVSAEDRKVEPRRAEEFAAKHGMIWMETSAKTAEGVNKLFE